jgi:hypothetical protein
MIKNDILTLIQLLILFILKTKLYQALETDFYCPEKDEIFYQDKCYKLVDLEFYAKFLECKNQDSNVDIVCIEEIFDRLASLYTNNPIINSEYEFNVLKSTFIRDRPDKIWLELIMRFVQNTYHTVIKSFDNNKFQIFLNFYSYKNHIYIRNKPINDEEPNIFIHSDSNRNNKCIFGQQIHTTNESFNFEYDDCNSQLPFICVKPSSLHINHDLNALNLDRCATLKTDIPGGNWIECDRLFPIFKNEKFSMSESQKCCMYNINSKMKYDMANRFCAKLNSHAYSFKSRGYKSMLENYAAYLNQNYHLKNKNFMKFWTSCRKYSENDKEEKCIEDLSESNENPKYYVPDLHFSNAFEIVSINLNINVNKNLRFKQVNFNLTLINKIIYRLSQNLTSKIFSGSEEMNREVNFETCNLINIHIDNSRDFLVQCLLLFMESLTKNSLFLVTRKSQPNFEIKLLRSHNFFKNQGITNKDKCFAYREISDRLVLLSLPFLNKCLHLTLFVNFESFNTSLSEIYNKGENVDHRISSLKVDEFYGILSSIGIIDIECELFLENLKEKSHVFLALNSSDNFLNCSSGLFRIKALSRFTSSDLEMKTYAISNFTHFLHKFNDILLSIHSYTPIEKILLLNCEQTAQETLNLIEECMIFYDEEYCVFKCPKTCIRNNRKNLWQLASFKYLFSSSICKAAQHSAIFDEVNKGILYLGKNSSNKSNTSESIIYIFNNGTQSSIWNPLEVVNPLNSNFERYFYFNNPKVIPKSTGSIYSNDQGMLVIVPAYIIINNHTLFNQNVEITVFLQRPLNNRSLRVTKLIKSIDHEKNDFYHDEILFNNKTYEFENFTMININISSNINLKKLNNFYELVFSDSYEKSLKFPLNFLNSDIQSYNYKYLKQQTQVIEINNSGFKRSLQLSLPKISHNCTWCISGINTEINCRQSLNLSDSFYFVKNVTSFNQEFIDDLIIYPSIRHRNYYKRFLRVIYTKRTIQNQSSNAICKNGGFYSLENQKCICLPGSAGKNCEIICEPGKFGPQCEMSCPNKDCNGYLICNQDPVGCKCASGYRGLACNETCPLLTWGSECLNKCTSCHSGKFFLI